MGEMSGWNQWVIDAGYYNPDVDLWCFVPIENPGTPEERLIVGMNLLSDPETFDSGELIGVVLLDGDDAAANEFYESHKQRIDAARQRTRKKENTNDK